MLMSLHGETEISSLATRGIRLDAGSVVADTRRGASFASILKFADAHKLSIDQWIEETVSGTKKVEERKLGQLLPTLQPQDGLIVTEISRPTDLRRSEPVI